MRTAFCVDAAAPGDVVYIPRGQLHGAAATSSRSLHVTSGVRLPSGALARAQLESALARLVALLQSDALAAEVEEHRSRAIARSKST